VVTDVPARGVLAVLHVLAPARAALGAGVATVPALVAGIAALPVAAVVAAPVPAPPLLAGALTLAVRTRLGARRLPGGRRLLDRGANGAVSANAGLAVAGCPRRIADAGAHWGGVADA
ncbi:MAG TPA: hypothetical protein VGY50_10970, partial [Streptosporangiaceae bacterium]|nr:hypothetical protein [Streptosporangiaceae bacterium]